MGDGRAGGLRVLIVTDQYEPMVGGVPTVTRELARGLAERGHAVEVLAPSSTGRSATAGRGASGRAGAAPGGQLTVARRGSVRWPWYEDQRLGLLGRAAAGELIAGFGPDVVHVHSPLTLGAAARSAARRRRVPVVYTNHYLPANVHPTADRADRAGARRRPAAPGDPAVGSTAPATRVASAPGPRRRRSAVPPARRPARCSTSASTGT